MRLVVFALLLQGLQAATVRISQIGPTVAHAYISGATGSCRWNLYEGPSATGTPHADVAGVLDTDRSDTITADTGVRIMRLGHDYGDFPLAVNTQYTLATDPSDTGCAGTSAVTFFTYFQPPPVTTRAFIPKWNANSWSGIWTPTYDFTTAGRNKTYVAPFTGLKYWFFSGQSGVNEWGTGTAPQDFAHTIGMSSDGGVGWTNAAAAANGPTSGPTTSNTATIPSGNTNHLVILPTFDLIRTWGGSIASGNAPWNFGNSNSLENIGLWVAGCGESATASDRTMMACITHNTSAANPTCQGTPVEILLPQGCTTINYVPSGGSDPDGVWPAAFMDTGFAGWNGGKLTRDLAPARVGVDHVTAGVVTGGGTWLNNFFPITAAGAFIYIPNTGSSPGLQKIESVQGPTQVTLVDKTVNITSGQINGDVFYWPTGVKLWRKTTGGDVRFSSRMKMHGMMEDIQSADAAPMCHPVEVTYNSIPGHLCYSNKSPQIVWFFLANDPAQGTHPVTRLHIGWPMWGNSHYTNITDQANDWLSNMDGQGNDMRGPFGFDPTDGRVIYGNYPCKSGTSFCIFKLTIRDLSPQYQYLGQNLYPNTASDADVSVAWQAGDVFVENMTPASQGKDLVSQLAASTYNWTRTGIYAAGSGYTGATWDHKGMAGDLSFWVLKPGTANQDNWPPIIAVWNIRTGNVVRVLPTHYQGETSGIPQLRWDTDHGVFINPGIPNTVSLSSEYPGNSGNASPGYSFFGAPITVKPRKILRSGVWSTDLELAQWPFTGTHSDYDKTCPTLPTVAQGRGNNTATDCVSIELETRMCAEATPQGGSPLQFLSTALGSAGTCPWNGSFADTPFTLQVGDRILPICPTCQQWTVTDHMMVVQILSASPLRVVLMRNSGADYSCVVGSKDPATTFCTHDPIPIGGDWYARMAAGSNETKGATGWMLRFDPTTGATLDVSEQNVQLSGHSALGYWVTNDRYKYVSQSLTIKNATITDFGGPSGFSVPASQRARRPDFSGHIFAGATSAYEQSYLNQTQLYGHNAQWTADVNHLNGPNGPTPLGDARNFVTVPNCTNVYKISPMTAGYSYKVAPLFGYAGHKTLEDISGPSVNICTAHDYSMVYVQRAGDSIGITAGANGGITPAAGDTFVKVPSAYLGGTADGCPTRQPWLNDPCVMFLGESRAGALRRFWSEGDDLEGVHSQTLLGMGPGFPGSHYFFSGSYNTPTGNSNILMAGTIIDGQRNTSLLVKLPPFRPEFNRRNNLNNATISVPAVSGATHARIMFGFDPTTFYCTGRAEACVTDSAMNTLTNPFAFVGETLTPHAFSGQPSITIPLPVDLGRAFYYKVQEFVSGAWTDVGGVKPIVVN